MVPGSNHLLSHNLDSILPINLHNLLAVLSRCGLHIVAKINNKCAVLLTALQCTFVVEEVVSSKPLETILDTPAALFVYCIPKASQSRRKK